jgi:hypothetical protein
MNCCGLGGYGTGLGPERTKDENTKIRISILSNMNEE